MRTNDWKHHPAEIAHGMKAAAVDLQKTIPFSLIIVGFAILSIRTVLLAEQDVSIKRCAVLLALLVFTPPLYLLALCCRVSPDLSSLGRLELYAVLGTGQTEESLPNQFQGPAPDTLVTC